MLSCQEFHQFSLTGQSDATACCFTHGVVGRHKLKLPTRDGIACVYDPD